MYSCSVYSVRDIEEKDNQLIIPCVVHTASSSPVWFKRCLSQFFHNWRQAINLKYMAPHIIMFLLEATAATLSMSGNRNWFMCVLCGACQAEKCAIANWGTRFSPDSPCAVPPGTDYWNLYSWLSFLQMLQPLEIVHAQMEHLDCFLQQEL